MILQAGAGNKDCTIMSIIILDVTRWSHGVTMPQPYLNGCHTNRIVPKDNILHSKMCELRYVFHFNRCLNAVKNVEGVNTLGMHCFHYQKLNILQFLILFREITIQLFFYFG